MEVKDIFEYNIMKAYQQPRHASRSDKSANTDKVSISPQASERLFGEMMEETLRKSLTENTSNED